MNNGARPLVGTANADGVDGVIAIRCAAVRCRHGGRGMMSSLHQALYQN